MLDNQNCVDNSTLENLCYQNSSENVELENALILGFTYEQNENLTMEDLINNSDDIINGNSMSGYYYCNNCDRLTYVDEMTFTENDTCYCNNCSDHYFYCDDCERYFDTGCEQMIHTENDDYICSNCYYNSYVTCDECGIAVLNDEYYYGEDTECYYCERCWDNRPRRVINNYSYKPEPIFYGNGKWHTGTELEIENKGCKDNNTIANEIIERFNNAIYCKTDGSLNRGFEIVSHPFDINTLYKNEEKVQSAMQYLINNDFRSDETSTCGLHVHVSRNAFGNDTETQEKNIEKMFLFFETYKSEICSLARRNGNSYAYFNSDNKDMNNKQKKYECLSLEYIKKYKDNGDRYKVINTNNRNTIEIRIFKGTLNFKTFMATIEFVNNLVEIITTTDTEKITFSKVVNGKYNKYLKDYVKLRGIKANYKYLHDYSKYLSILASKENKRKDKIYQNMLLMGKYIENVCKDLLNSEKYKRECIYNIYGSNYMGQAIERYRNIISQYDCYKEDTSEKIKNELNNKMYYLRQTIEYLQFNEYISYEKYSEYLELENAIMEVE